MTSHEMPRRRRGRSAPAAMAILTLLATGGTARAAERGPAGPQTLTLEAAIQLAWQRNGDALVSAQEIVAAGYARKSKRGAFGPRLRVEANVLRWEGPFETSFTIPGSPMSFPPVVVREAVTSTINASVVQPFTQLLNVYHDYKEAAAGVDIARIRHEVVRRDLAYQVTESYFRLLQAARLSEVAAKSVEQLEAQVRRAESFHRQGLVAQNDLLRAQLGLSSARQRLVQMRGQVALARSRLAVQLGLSPGEVIRPVPPAAAAAVTGTSPDAAALPRPRLSVEVAERRAVTRRAEIRDLALRLEQAQRAVRLAKVAYAPQVNGVVNYQHNEGSAFQQKDAFYVGALLSWDLWEWGATHYGVKQAQARYRQAELGRKKLEDGIRLEVRAAYVAATTAAETLVLARKALEQAEENFRVETRRYEANATTSFDVLDAETQLSRSRGQLETALYDYLIADASLQRSMGETVAQGGR